MTGRSIAISLFAHAALLALLLHEPERAAAPPVPPPTAVEIVEVPPPPAPPPHYGAVHHGEAAARPAGSRPPVRPGSRGVGSLSISAEVRGGAGERGEGGEGGGGGGGAGLGWMAPEQVAPAPPPPPAAAAQVAAPARSKARPARLIFPTRHRTAEDGPVFTASLDVDDEGYVVGVRLLRGIGGRRDQIAEREVWRFRYDPARDDQGRPIRSRVEQRFMLD